MSFELGIIIGDIIGTITTSIVFFIIIKRLKELPMTFKESYELLEKNNQDAI